MCHPYGILRGWIPASAGTTRHGRLDTTLAAKALLRIEDKKDYKPDWNSDYTALKTYYNSENNLRLPRLYHFEYVRACPAII
jgi:hypothetical protein